MSISSDIRISRRPHPRVVLELPKPITWFPPMWAYMCGVVSSGVPITERWGAFALGVVLAGPVVCWVMAVPQIMVIGLLVGWGKPVHATVVAMLVLAQGAAMMRLLRDPKALAPWYNATGVMLYVLGMLASAFALAGLG